MKKFLFAAAAVLAFASCSNDETIIEKVDANKIRYSVAAEVQSRAADVYCNNHLMEAFKIYAATTDGKTYINGDNVNVVSLVSEGGMYTASGQAFADVERYWPESALNFCAIANNDENTFTYDGTNPGKVSFTVNSDVASQKDLLYAVANNVSKSTNDGVVKLNFRHALSQVVFRARKENQNIHVVIKGISVGGVKNAGTYTLPSENSDVNMPHATPETYVTTGRGSWDETTGKSTFSVADFEVAVPFAASSDNAANLTVGTEGGQMILGENTVQIARDFSKAMLLLPEKTTAYDPTVAGKDTEKDGTYFLVNADIYNVAGDEFDAENDVKLHSGNIRIPVAFNWEEGYCYIYTIVFGKKGSTGGTIPGDGPEDPVYTPITYEITVDEFMEAGNEDAKIGDNGGLVLLQ